MDNALEILDRIHQAQLGTFVDLLRFRERSFTQILPRNQRGMYWLWTELSDDELENNTLPSQNKEVPISHLISQRKNLRNICNVSLNGFKVVYNGIGGYRRSRSNGLRERINQEVIGNGPTVGTLNILQNSDIRRWSVSFFNFDDPRNSEIIEMLDANNPYVELGKDLEIMWRLQYGTPILCRH